MNKDEKWLISFTYTDTRHERPLSAEIKSGSVSGILSRLTALTRSQLIDKTDIRQEAIESQYLVVDTFDEGFLCVSLRGLRAIQITALPVLPGDNQRDNS